ncbi:expressed unknown protein [Seminavis robusta]|uniref:Uncharacterized protein n=1 Tax=Seminavis robusta TaxID=568900 RepID=A0A9N8DJL4_9STRA|nr:expressed unknown protein [Seminavis robusta]|eukprot:Sro179_g078410.1 n/a (146) ;mRNA; r:22490-22927
MWLEDEDVDGDSGSSNEEEDIQRMIEQFSAEQKAESGKNSSKKKQGTKRQGNQKSKKKHRPNSLDDLHEKLGQLTARLEKQGVFIPPSLDDADDDGRSGKVWSNRNYGADKKRQRKEAERFFLKRRIEQLEKLCQKHNMEGNDCR